LIYTKALTSTPIHVAIKAMGEHGEGIGPDRAGALTSGVRLDPNQYAAVTSGLASLYDWPAAFRQAGRDHVGIAGRAEAVGRTVSAGEAYRDAAL
jgi:hypothetical protein